MTDAAKHRDDHARLLEAGVAWNEVCDRPKHPDFPGRRRVIGLRLRGHLSLHGIDAVVALRGMAVGGDTFAALFDLHNRTHLTAGGDA